MLIASKLTAHYFTSLANKNLFTCGFRMGVRKDSERFSLWSLSLKISYRRNCKLSWIGKPKKKKS